jgi:type IV secretory pathway TraG/TraD family ATPase VirD4
MNTEELTVWLISLVVIVVVLVALWLLRYKIGRLLLNMLKAPVTYIKYRLKLWGMVKRLRSRSHGIQFGKAKCGRLVCSPENKEEHALCIGGSGSGKTAALITPTVQNFRGSVFCLDISQDITIHAQRGDKAVVCLTDDYTGSDGGYTFDVLAAVDNAPSMSEKCELLMQLAFCLIPEISQDDNAIYYETSARTVLQAALLAFYFSPDRLDIVPIFQHVLSSSFDFLIEDIKASGNDRAISLVASFEDVNEKMNAATKQLVDASVAIFCVNEAVGNSIGRSNLSVSPSDLEDKSIYVVLPEHKISLYAPALSLITSSVLSYLTARPILRKSKRILVVLDEFPQLRLDISNALMTVRKRRVRILAVIQSLPILFDLFGKYKAQGMLDNFLFLVVMKCTDPDTQEWLSKKAGSHWHNERQYRNIEPSEFGVLDKRLVLFHPRGYMTLKKSYYFKGFFKSLLRLYSKIIGKRRNL